MEVFDATWMTVGILIFLASYLVKGFMEGSGNPLDVDDQDFFPAVLIVSTLWPLAMLVFAVFLVGCASIEVPRRLGKILAEKIEEYKDE